MKTKILLLVVATVFWSTTVFGQFSLGAKGGLNLAQFNQDYNLNSDDYEQEFNQGISFGLLAEMSLTDNFYLQPEFNFIQRGLSLSDKQNEEAYYNFNWNYLDLPILGKYKFNLSDQLNWYIAAGPSFGYAISAKEKVNLWAMQNDESEPSRVSNEEMYDFRSEFDNGERDNRFDFALQAGTGVEFKLGTGHLLLDARYGWDLTNNVVFENDVPSDFSGAQNRDLNFTLGYKLPFGK